MSVLARAQITIIVINDGPTGPTGKRMLTGMVHYQLSNASAPAKPSATAFNFSTRVFSGLTANWAIDSPVYASGNANKYWYCPYTVEESTSGSGTGTPVFGTVKQAIGFSGLVTFTGDQSVSDGTKTLSFGSAGTTKIDGGNIETGTVSADRIDVDNLVVKQAVIGKIQDVAGPLATTAKSEAISAAASDATTKMNAAKDALAQEAGYTNFADMASKAALTVNGLLNSNIINTDQIFANKLLAFSAFIDNLTVRKLLTPIDSLNARVEIKEPTTADPYARITITGADASIWTTYLRMFVESAADSGLDSPSAALEITTNYGTNTSTRGKLTVEGIEAYKVWGKSNPATSSGLSSMYKYYGMIVKYKSSGGEYAVKINITYNKGTGTIDFILDGLPTANPGGSVTVWKDSKGFLRIGAAVAYTASDVGAVPTSRTVNGKALSADITLSASDVGAAASSHTHSYVPTSRTVNSKALSENITLSAADVGAAAASHSHTKGQISDFPSSMPASDVYAWAKASAKPSYTYSEVGAAASSHTHSYVPTSRTVNSKALSANITLSAADVGALASNAIQYFTQAQWDALSQAQKDAVPLAVVGE